MARLLAIYSTPSDPEAFDTYYHGTHMPLFKTVAGVGRITFSNGPPTALAGSAPYLVTQAEFKSMDAIHAALASPEGKAAAADLANFAQAGVTLLIYDTREEGA